MVEFRKIPPPTPIHELNRPPYIILDNSVRENLRKLVAQYQLSDNKAQSLYNTLLATISHVSLSDHIFACGKDYVQMQKQVKKAARSLIKVGANSPQVVKAWPGFSCLLEEASKIIEINYTDGMGRGKPIDHKMKTAIYSLADAYADTFEKMPTVSKHETVIKKKSHFHHFCEKVLPIYGIEKTIPVTTLDRYLSSWNANNQHDLARKASFDTIAKPRHRHKKGK